MDGDQRLRPGGLVCFYPHLQSSSQWGSPRQKQVSERHLQGESSDVSAKKMRHALLRRLLYLSLVSCLELHPGGEVLRVLLPVSYIDSFDGLLSFLPYSCSMLGLSQWMDGKTAFHPEQKFTLQGSRVCSIALLPFKAHIILPQDL